VTFFGCDDDEMILPLDIFSFFKFVPIKTAFTRIRLGVVCVLCLWVCVLRLVCVCLLFLGPCKKVLSLIA
jgi:hypothetical protein